MKNKHMSSIDRIKIENSLNEGLPFKAIGKNLNRDCTTISKEIRLNFETRNAGAYGRIFNNCLNRSTCKKEYICSDCIFQKPKFCRNCKSCRDNCSNFIEEVCIKLSKSPYVCNGCEDKRKCTLSKNIYFGLVANKKYEERLSESRKGFIINEAQIKHLNELLIPLIKNQGQSIHHVFIHHKDEIMMSEKTLYTLIDACVLKVKNIDLPRQVRYRPRRKKSTAYKVDKSCLENRRYEDFKEFIKMHPDKAVVEMDTVEGEKSESCLLTIHFPISSFMIAIKREYNVSKSVIDFFNDVYDTLGRETFMQLFSVILTDNGSEFSNPEAIEFDDNGDRRTYVFYCHPNAPYEKGACEVNHELVRRIVPKGITWNQYNQKDINLMMSHINSYARKKLNDKSPLLLFNSLFNEEITSFFNISCIEPDDINLTRGLLSK